MQSSITIYNEQGDQLGSGHDLGTIQEILNTIGVIYERWDANTPLAVDADQDAVLAAYADDINTLNQRFNFQSIDVVSLQPDNPKKDEMRQMFLSEHTHDDFEVRFFVEGQGLFYLRPQQEAPGKVMAVHCTAGDLISVPAGMTHWFDMGPEPSFKAIRFFSTDNGWVGHFTDSGIAERFPLFQQA